MHIHAIDAEDVIQALRRRLRAEHRRLEILLHMHDIGRARAEAWLAGDFDGVGARWSVDIHQNASEAAVRPRREARDGIGEARPRGFPSRAGGLHGPSTLATLPGHDDQASAEDRTARRARGVDRRRRRSLGLLLQPAWWRTATKVATISSTRSSARSPTRSGAPGGAGCWRCRACRRWSAKRRRYPADR